MQEANAKGLDYVIVSMKNETAQSSSKKIRKRFVEF